MSSCTSCGKWFSREMSRDEEEGGYGYCDDCENDYHKRMSEEEERLNREGRSLYGVFCGYCGRLRSFEEVSYGGDCRCGGADAEYLDDLYASEAFAPTPEEIDAYEAKLNQIVNQLDEEPPF